MADQAESPTARDMRDLARALRSFHPTASLVEMVELIWQATGRDDLPHLTTAAACWAIKNGRGSS